MGTPNLPQALGRGSYPFANTQILTEWAPNIESLLSYQYRYRNIASSSLPNQATPTDPDGSVITRYLQEKLDEQVSVKDYGATGNGTTDDTYAIRLAAIDVTTTTSPNFQRQLYFPAGDYVIFDFILIPPNSSWIGDGIGRTNIICSTNAGCVAQTCDGALSIDDLNTEPPTISNHIEYNITAGMPTNISISGISFINQNTTFLTSIIQALVVTLINSGGSLYQVSDVLTVSGGTFTSAATLTVMSVNLSGAVLSVSISSSGSYSVAPTNPVSVAGGHGTGASFTINFGIASVNDVVRLWRASDVYINNCSFEGAWVCGGHSDFVGYNAMTDGVGLSIDSLGGTALCSNINLLECKFSSITYGLFLTDNVHEVTLDQGIFENLFKGIDLGDSAVSPGFFTTSFSITNINILTAGTSYTSNPSVSITSSAAGTGATVQSFIGIVGATINSGGTGYAQGDVGSILTLVGGTFTTPASLIISQVNGGSGTGPITGVTIDGTGSYTAAPTNPVSVTGGSGTSATFNLNFGLTQIELTNPGSGYTASTTSIMVSGGGGSGATAEVIIPGPTAIKAVNNLFRNIQNEGFYVASNYGTSFGNISAFNRFENVGFGSINCGTGSGTTTPQITFGLHTLYNITIGDTFDRLGPTALNPLYRRVNYSVSDPNMIYDPQDPFFPSSGGGSPLTVTDGTNTVADTTEITFSGATVSGSTPNAIVTINIISQPYDIAVYSGNDSPLFSSQVIIRYTADRALSFLSDFSGSQSTSEISATANVTLNIDHALAASPNTFSTIGTISFSPSGNVGTFDSSGHAPQSLASGDVLRIIGPIIADATLSGLSVTLAGTRAG